MWTPGDTFDPPPLDLAPVSDEPRVPLFSSAGIGWSTSFGEHQNGDRKMTWQTAVPVIPEEEPSPFVAVASVADAASMVTNWGSNGVEHINTDIALTLARLPVSREIGLAALDRVSSDGIASGVAAVFDRRGTHRQRDGRLARERQADRRLRGARLRRRPPGRGSLSLLLPWASSLSNVNPRLVCRQGPPDFESGLAT